MTGTVILRRPGLNGGEWEVKESRAGSRVESVGREGLGMPGLNEAAAGSNYVFYTLSFLLFIFLRIYCFSLKLKESENKRAFKGNGVLQCAKQGLTL